MKINISYPVTGAQKVLEVDDDNKLRAFYDKRISHEVTGDHLGDEYKGYVFKISGGNDKQGFCMTQGILTTGRVRILMREGMVGYRCRKRGERKRKSARGCIVSSDLSVLNLVIVKKGEKDIDGLTTAEAARPRRLGPKRASKIRKLFNLSKDDDVRQFVVRRPVTTKTGKTVYKAPKIQRLVRATQQHTHTQPPSHTHPSHPSITRPALDGADDQPTLEDAWHSLRAAKLHAFSVGLIHARILPFLRPPSSAALFLPFASPCQLV